MAYCLASEVIGLFPGLPQTSTAAGYSTTSVLIASHITRADSLIDGKCARRYAVPFATTSTSTPPLIHSLSQDITAYFTYRSKFSGDNQNRFEYLDDLYKLAMDTLDAISKSEMDVVDTSGAVIGETGESTRVYSSTQNYTPLFDVDDEKSWKFDPDRISAIGDSRG